MDLGKEAEGVVIPFGPRDIGQEIPVVAGNMALSTQIDDLPEYKEPLRSERNVGNATFSGNPEDPIALYLNGIGKTPLLTKDEEVALAKQIERGRELKDVENPTIAQRRDLLRAADAKDQFIRANLRLVVSIARRYPLPQGMDLLDLVQEGNLGLEHAVDKFDYERGFKFSTYSTFWIRQAIGRALDQKASLIRLPGDRSASLRAALRAAKGDGEQLDSETADLHRLTTPVSLDKAVGDDGDATLGDLIADDKKSDPVNTIIDEDETNVLDELLSTLDGRTKFAVQQRFGLIDGERKSFKEIGEMLGTTAEASRRLISRAIVVLRKTAPDYFGDLGEFG